MQWHFQFVCQSHVTFARQHISYLWSCHGACGSNGIVNSEIAISQSRAAVARVWVSVSFVTKGYSHFLCIAVWHWHYSSKCHNSYEIYVSFVCLFPSLFVSWKGVLAFVILTCGQKNRGEQMEGWGTSNNAGSLVLYAPSPFCYHSWKLFSLRTPSYQNFSSQLSLSLK